MRRFAIVNQSAALLQTATTGALYLSSAAASTAAPTYPKAEPSPAKGARRTQKSTSPSAASRSGVRRSNCRRGREISMKAIHEAPLTLLSRIVLGGAIVQAVHAQAKPPVPVHGIKEVA
jgi:hypothetical protein